MQLAWRDLDRNEWVTALRTALAAGRTLPTPPHGAPGPFGLARGLTADLDEATCAAALDQLHRTLKDHETADGVLFAGSAWLIVGCR